MPRASNVLFYRCFTKRVLALDGLLHPAECQRGFHLDILPQYLMRGLR
jgi:hypothetical protein